MDRDPTEFEIGEATRVLKLMADPTRLKIIWALLHGEHSVNALAEHLGVQPAAVSQHLAKLRLARMVRVRHEGTRVFYKVEDAHLERLATEAVFHVDHLVAAPGPSRHGRKATSRTA